MERAPLDQNANDRTLADAWVLLGTIGAGGRAKVDRRGVMTPEGATWSLDWWVGAEDRWHVASGSALVRQSLVESTPVVLSAMRLPGGEIEQRAWSVVDGSTGSPVLVVAFHNATSIPVALALAVTSSSNASSTIDFSDGIVTLNGDAIAAFSRLPSRFGIELEGRSAEDITTAGDAVNAFPDGGIELCREGTTTSFVFPLPHTATLQVVLPLGAAMSVADLKCCDLNALPPFERVVAGWKAQTARAPKFDLPERQSEEAIDGSRSHLLVHVAGEDPLRWPGVPVNGLERSDLTMALDEQGLSAEAERLLIASTDLQNADGSFDSRRLDATASWVVTLERHVALSGDAAFADQMIERVASAAHWIAKRQRGSRLRRSSSFFANGNGPVWLDADERVGYDARWTARAYRSAIALLDGAAQPDAALAVRLHLAALLDEMDLRGVSRVGPGDGTVDDGAILRLRRELLSGEPLWVWPSETDAHDPSRTAAFLRNIRAIVASDADGVIDMLPGFNEEWLGQPIAVHRLPTAFGLLSFALRWHGARPALLWEVEGDRNLTLRCASIDPEWSTTDQRGEALLEAPVFDHVHRHLDHASEESVPETPVDEGTSFT
ncbi:MAG: hypothetical protein F2947_00655 [Actinobacteria bacterium]|uniref:Unannotated protein n=2 Tax=freshwater metagenome TaxID=449393 RepID=A0A6J5ZGP8_9ZZZZ|nr:hypothetical protein [Actinomycetota bacterium]MSX34134.1 hypothetical protein [Actinomycetota bacterium]MSX95627.1 hypothetical protein [Actinomycetota bacterium]MSY24625.1 hypothetical protein [Actinomycetota bacterium]MSY33498.1 hypothetical protein [Actinomycetota bacterium]